MTHFLLPENAITVLRGQSRTIGLTVKEPDPDSPCQKYRLMNLTGCTLYFSVKAAVGDQYPLIFKSSGNPAEIDIIKPREGRALIYLTHLDTDIDPKEYVFDVWVKLVTGKRNPVIWPSTLKVELGVTKIP